MHTHHVLPGSISLERRQLAQKFAALAWIILACVLPVAMVLANRSAPASIVTAGLCSLVSVALSGTISAFSANLRRICLTKESAVALVFVAWCAVSISWSPVPKVSWFAFGEVSLPVVAAILLAAGLGRPPAWLPKVMLGALVVALLGLAVELGDGLLLRRVLGGRFDAFTLNRPMVVALLLALPLCEMLVSSGRRWLALALVVGLCGVLVITASHSSKAGMAAAILAFAAASLLPRLSLWLGMLAVLALLAAAPQIGNAARSILPAHTLDTVEEGHPKERVLIWETFGEVAKLRPASGIGFNGSPNADKSSVAADLNPERRYVLTWGHPHNVFLQVWAELGLVGVVLTALGIVLLFLHLARCRDTILPYRLAGIAAVASIGIVSHGAWQGWWFAGIAAQVLLFMASSKLMTTDPADPV